VTTPQNGAARRFAPQKKIALLVTTHDDPDQSIMTDQGLSSMGMKTLIPRYADDGETGEKRRGHRDRCSRDPEPGRPARHGRARGASVRPDGDRRDFNQRNVAVMQARAAGVSCNVSTIERRAIC
jgi:hypothetical protein